LYLSPKTRVTLVSFRFGAGGKVVGSIAAPGSLLRAVHVVPEPAQEVSIMQRQKIT